MVQSFIERQATSGGGFDGRILNINIINIQRSKGVQPTRGLLPGQDAENQFKAPISGQEDILRVQVRIKPEDVNVAFDVNSSGTENPRGITSKVDQYNFLYDEILNGFITSTYELYIDKLGKTIIGQILVQDIKVNADSQEEFILEIQIFTGLNIFSLFS